MDSAAFQLFPLGTLLSTPAGDPLRLACASLAPIPPAPFAQLVAAAAARVAGAPSPAPLEAHAALAQASSAVPRAECARALLALLVDFARCGAAPAAVRGAVEDAGLPGAHAGAFADAYGGALAGMRAALDAAGASV